MAINSTTQKFYSYICNDLKKIIAISLLSIFLCANTEIGQLLKLPTLIHHYFEHHNDKDEDDHDISFIDFLKKHYNENDNHPSNTKHDHQNLPFKTTDCNSINSVIALVQQTVFTLHTTSIISEKNIAAYTEQHYTSKSFGSIWQPPRLG
jgi:flagellar hook-basal body complex protein FliE